MDIFVAYVLRAHSECVWCVICKCWQYFKVISTWLQWYKLMSTCLKINVGSPWKVFEFYFLTTVGTLSSVVTWLIELYWLSMVFTSVPTQYRLYGRLFLQVWWPNQQCQSTEGGWLVIQTGLSLTMLTSLCYNTTTCMQILHKKII